MSNSQFSQVFAVFALSCSLLAGCAGDIGKASTGPVVPASSPASGSIDPISRRYLLGSWRQTSPSPIVGDCTKSTAPSLTFGMEKGKLEVTRTNTGEALFSVMTGFMSLLLYDHEYVETLGSDGEVLTLETRKGRTRLRELYRPTDQNHMERQSATRTPNKTKAGILTSSIGATYERCPLFQPEN